MEFKNIVLGIYNTKTDGFEIVILDKVNNTRLWRGVVWMAINKGKLNII